MLSNDCLHQCLRIRLWRVIFCKVSSWVTHVEYIRERGELVDETLSTPSKFVCKSHDTTRFLSRPCNDCGVGFSPLSSNACLVDMIELYHFDLTGDKVSVHPLFTTHPQIQEMGASGRSVVYTLLFLVLIWVSLHNLGANGGHQWGTALQKATNHELWNLWVQNSQQDATKHPLFLSMQELNPDNQQHWDLSSC